MAEYVAKRDSDRAPTHPGVLVKEAVNATGKPKAMIARLLGISRQHLYDIMAEAKPVSPEMAVKLGKLFGNGPMLWLHMQIIHDAWKAEKALATELKKMPTLSAA